MNPVALEKSQVQAGAKSRRQGKTLADNPWLDDRWNIAHNQNTKRLKEAWDLGWAQQEAKQRAVK